MPGENGKTTTVIFRADSLKFYILDREKKTWMSIDPTSITRGTFYGIAALEHEGNSVKRTFIKEENVGGYSCRHYRVESALAHKGGTTSYSDWDEWVYEPYKLVIRRSDDIRPDNIRSGEISQWSRSPKAYLEFRKSIKVRQCPSAEYLRCLPDNPKSRVSRKWMKQGINCRKSGRCWRMQMIRTKFKSRNCKKR